MSVWSQDSKSQNTYNFLYDPDSLAVFNYVYDMELYHDRIYLSSKQYCYISPNKYAECFVVSKFSLEGKLLGRITLDTLFANYRSNNIALAGGNIYITGTNQTQTIIGRKNPVIVLDTALQYIASYEYEGDSDKVLTNTGIYADEELVVLTFLEVNYEEKPFDGLVYFIDRKTMNLMNKRAYTKGSFLVEIKSFQSTPDGNFAFLMDSSPRAGAGHEPSLSTIYKINAQGDTLGTFTATDLLGKLRRMLVSSDGSYYFPGEFKDDWDGLNRGLINKINGVMKSRTWVLKYPSDYGINRRSYISQEFTEAQNGDILGCGQVQEWADGEENLTYNGFVVRFTPEGELKWVRLYRHPKVLRKDTIGRFENSYFKKIAEADDGSIIISGEVSSGLNQEEDAKNNSNIWMIKLNEDGCLDGFPCQEIIRLDSAEQLDPPYFDIGSSWFYDYFIDINNKQIKQHSYIQFTIIDTIRKEGDLVYKIVNNRGLPIEYMKQDGPKIFFWDETASDWQLTYHFYGNLAYPTIFGNDVASTVTIDTTIYFYFGSYGQQNLQKVRIKIPDKTEIKRDVLKKCGFTTRGLRFRHELNPNDSIGKIRCYSKGSFFYDFQLYPKRPCDSVWTDVLNSDVEIDYNDNSFGVYPIPFNEYFCVHSKGIENAITLEVFNILGDKIYTDVIFDEKTCIDTNNWSSGTYILSLSHKNTSTIRKIILKQ